MSILCAFGIHSWKACRCERCGKTRDAEHQWKGCKCPSCGKVKDTEHHWRKCECEVCGKVENIVGIEKNVKMKEPFDDAVAELEILYKEWSAAPVFFSRSKALEGKKDAVWMIKQYLDGKGQREKESIRSWYEYDRKYTAGTHDEFNLGRLDILEWAVHRLGL